MPSETNRGRRRSAFAAFAILFLLAGCHATPAPVPEPLPVPTSLVSTDHFLGTTLSGPVAGTLPSFDPASALEIRVTMIALEHVPNANFTPLGSAATFVSATGGRNAVLPAEQLMTNIQLLDPKDPTDFPAILRSAGAGRLREIMSQPGSLPPGITADFSASDPDAIQDPVTAAPINRKLEVRVIRPADAGQPPRIALVVTDQTTSIPPELRTEQALFDVDSPARSLTAFIVPFRFDHATSRAVAVLVSISPGNTHQDHVTVTTSAMKQVTAHLDQHAPEISNGQAGQEATLTAAISGLKSVPSRRTSLAFVANQTGASLAEDLALEADDATLAQLVDLAKLPSDPQSSVAIGWRLDHASLMLLAKLLDSSNNSTAGAKMPDELFAVLTNYTGEVGRHPSSLGDVLAGVNSQAELDNRLLAENTIYLEDNSPASRVRAFDWLKSHGHAPADFDPLATGKQRQKQLEQALNPPTTAPTTAP